MERLINDFFDERLLKELDSICDSFDITDNNDRADEAIAVLNDYGFEEEGCGTNRICVSKPNEPYAIKIALDSRGVKDNNAESFLSKEQFLRDNNIVTKTFANNGLILFAEKVETMRSEDYYYYKEEIMDMMKLLVPYYILNDIGPDSFRNFGIVDDKPIIIDYAYLSRTDMAEIKYCIRKKKNGKLCKGRLQYTEDYKFMVCKKCGKQYTLGKVAGEHYVDPILEDGFYIPGITD